VPEKKNHNGAPSAGECARQTIQERGLIPRVGEKGRKLTEAGKIEGKGNTEGTFPRNSIQMEIKSFLQLHHLKRRSH